MDRKREEHVEPVGGPRAAHRSAPAPSFACSCSPTKSASPVILSPLSHERGMYARRRLTPLLGSAAHHQGVEKMLTNGVPAKPADRRHDDVERPQNE